VHLTLKSGKRQSTTAYQRWSTTSWRDRSQMCSIRYRTKNCCCNNSSKSSS